MIRVWRGAGRPDTYKPSIAVKGTFFTKMNGLYREGLLLGTGLQKKKCGGALSSPWNIGINEKIPDSNLSGIFFIRVREPCSHNFLFRGKEEYLRIYQHFPALHYTRQEPGTDHHCSGQAFVSDTWSLP